MNQHLHLVTLGVWDLAVSRQFYAETLGWQPSAASSDDVVFFQAGGAVLDWRDIGTVILPDADVKFFMTASDDARAVSRQAELEEKGEKMTVEEVKKALSARDEQDRTRDIAPAIPADDATCKPAPGG